MVIVIPNDWAQLLAIGDSVQSSDVGDSERKDQENNKIAKRVKQIVNSSVNKKNVCTHNTYI